MKALFVSIILPLLFLLSACGKADTVWLNTPDEPASQEEPIQFGTGIDKSQRLNEEFNPKLEIVFVIDNSTSMKPHIIKLSNNINRFVDVFTKNTPFQYNVAVMSVYDHRRFKGEKFIAAHGGTDLEFDVGEFRPVKDISGKDIPGKFFISSNDDDVAGMLKRTLKVGVQDLNGAGPEVEETFLPLASAYGVGDIKQKPETKEKQKAFFMGKNSYKVIFFLTDAADNSLMSASDLYMNMLTNEDIAHGDRRKIMGFGAISIDNCKRDPGKKNEQIEDFLELSRAGSTKNVVSLCSNFGDQFASFGKAIRKRILSQTIPLTRGIPDVSNIATSETHAGKKDSHSECIKPVAERDASSLVVCYGQQRIFARSTNNGPLGYTINPDTNRIRLDEGFRFDEAQQGAPLEAVYRPIHAESRRKGNVKPQGH